MSNATKFDAGGIRWQARCPKTAARVAGLVDSPLLHAPTQAIKQSAQTTVTLIPATATAQDALLLRRNNYGRLATRLRDCLRTSAAERAYRASLLLEKAGIPAARVIAAGTRRVLRVPIAAYALMEPIAPSHTLREYWEKHRHLPLPVVRRLAELIADLHQRGFTHGDLTINNVLLDNSLKPWLIDLDRVKAGRRPVTQRETVEDLHRLARHLHTLGKRAEFTALRLLKLYCARRRWTGQERALAEAVLRRVWQKNSMPTGSKIRGQLGQALGYGQVLVAVENFQAAACGWDAVAKILLVI